MKRNYVFSLLVGLLLIFTLTACGEKMPTKCPDYIDLSLDREIALLEEIYPDVSGVNTDELLPQNVFKVYAATKLGGDKNIIYITSDNVLYLVDYRCREVDGVLYKYVTKLAVREGDRYIYKVDNWSNDGLMVAEYNDTYYDYFNRYKESQGKPTATPPENREDTYPSLPSYIDHSGKRQLALLEQILDADFSEQTNVKNFVSQFIPNGATPYAIEEKDTHKRIAYVTSDGIYYDEIYYYGETGGRKVEISARRITDNYVYTIQINENNEVVLTYYATVSTFLNSVAVFEQWCRDRGQNPPPEPSQYSLIYKGTSWIKYK